MKRFGAREPCKCFFIYLNFAFSRACFLRNQGYVLLLHVDSESDPLNFFL